MMKLKNIIIFILSSFLLYLLASLFFLNGRLTYWTSFNESTVEDSKSKKIFITDKLQIVTKGDSLINWNDKFEIWTNKRVKIKYYGILFHWTFEDSNWRYLNFNPIQEYIDKTYFRKK